MLNVETPVTLTSPFTVSAVVDPPTTVLLNVETPVTLIPLLLILRMDDPAETKVICLGPGENTPVWLSSTI